MNGGGLLALGLFYLFAPIVTYASPGVRFERRLGGGEPKVEQDAVPGTLPGETVTFTMTLEEGGQISYLSTIDSGALFENKVNLDKTAIVNRPYALVTVLRAPKDCDLDLNAQLDALANQDDVWNRAFLDLLILDPAECGTKWSQRYKGQVATVVKGSKSPTPGPYLVIGNIGQEVVLHPVYRLYPDPQSAFTTGLLPAAPAASNYTLTQFAQSSTGSGGMTSVQIPVPSRLYSIDDTRPLAGKRVAVKDLYDVAGVRTGGGSRAYYSHTPPANVTAYSMQKLLASGAVFVGKTKASQFGNSETPTADWIDQLCPFNPRGDGYQDPMSSSSGSAVALASYDWLDIATGTDSGGSIRSTAAFDGLLGIRPSHGAVSHTGVIPLCNLFDTSAYFSRDENLFRTVGEVVYADTIAKTPGSIKTLQVPADFWRGMLNEDGTPDATDPTTQAPAIFADFIQKLAGVLSEGGEPVKIDRDEFEAKWETISSITDPLTTYMNLTYAQLVGYYQHKEFGAPFIDSYRKAHGRDPFISPTPLVRWTWSAEQGEKLYNDELKRREVFRDFVAKAIPEDAILVYPQSYGVPYYRNTYLGAPLPPWQFRALRISTFGEGPEITFPIDQVKYNSTITNSDQDSIPVSISILTKKGGDLTLLDLAQKLKKAGVTKQIITGPSTF